MAQKLEYVCGFFGTRLNFNESNFSLCHEAQVGDRILGSIEELSVEKYDKAIEKLIYENRNESAPCRKCTKCEQQYYNKDNKINYITLCMSSYCNSACIYCMSHFSPEGTGYNPIPYLEEFHNKGRISDDCYFDWGGGEPTLNKYFEQTVEWIADNHYRQRINTNAIIYSESVEKALRQKKAEVRISTDSGSKECFVRMKGNEYYDDVWNSISRYCKVSDSVYIKYNICNYNSDKKEIMCFVDKCVDAGVKHVIVDAEVSAYQSLKNCGPFFFTQKEFESAHYLRKYAEEKGLNVEISPYAFSVRAEYDEKGNLDLPNKYFDNIDYTVLSSDIWPETFPSVQNMTEHIDRSKPIYIWGAGQVGKKIFELLRDDGIDAAGIVDISENMQGKTIYDKEIKMPEYLKEIKEQMTVILAGNYGQDKLKWINDNKIENIKVYWMKHI